MEPEIQFTLVEDKQTFLVRDALDHTIRLTRYGSGKVDVQPGVHDTFLFRQSDPNIVLVIGRLLVAAARQAGADAA